MKFNEIINPTPAIQKIIEFIEGLKDNPNVKYLGANDRFINFYILRCRSISSFGRIAHVQSSTEDSLMVVRYHNGYIESNHGRTAMLDLDDIEESETLYNTITAVLCEKSEVYKSFDKGELDLNPKLFPKQSY